MTSGICLTNMYPDTLASSWTETVAGLGSADVRGERAM
jgi:hypothetical protein